MPTRVVNLRTESYDVYIGRPGKGQTGPFGNPFKINLDEIQDFGCFVNH